MSYDRNTLTNAITKLFKFVKPDDVIDINFKVIPFDGKDNEFLMEIVYVVPDKLFKDYKTKLSSESTSGWNVIVRKNIRDYLGVNVTIYSTAMAKESWVIEDKKNK